MIYFERFLVIPRRASSSSAPRTTWATPPVAASGDLWPRSAGPVNLVVPRPGNPMEMLGFYGKILGFYGTMFFFSMGFWYVFYDKMRDNWTWVDPKFIRFESVLVINLFWDNISINLNFPHVTEPIQIHHLSLSALSRYHTEMWIDTIYTPVE